MDFAFCHKRRKSYKFTEDVARDWDYYIPGVEWTPRRIKTITTLRPPPSTDENRDQESSRDDTEEEVTTTEIDYRLDPDEYRFSLPTKDSCIRAENISPIHPDTDHAIRITSLKQKYDDFQVSIDIEDSLVTVKSPNTLLSRTPDTISWNGNLWKSATGRVRKILQQFMELVASPPNNKELTAKRAARAAIKVDAQCNIIAVSKEIMADNNGFTDSGYLDDYDIPCLQSGRDSTLTRSRNTSHNSDSISGNSVKPTCPVHFVCEPSDGKSSLCSRCMRECKATSSESSLVAIGQHCHLKKSPQNARNNSDIRQWHMDNHYKTESISPELSSTIECMTPTSPEDYTLEVNTPFIDQILKGSVSDMGILFPTSSRSDKYCLNHLDDNHKDDLRRQLFNNDEDLEQRSFSNSSLISPHENKHLYCLTFDDADCDCEIEDETFENSNIKNSSIEDTKSLTWEEM